MKRIHPIMYASVIWVAIATVVLFSFFCAAHISASETKASVLLTQDRDSSYRQWVGIPISELAKVGNRALCSPYSFPKAIQAFTAIVGRYEGRGVDDSDYRAVVSAMNNLGYIYTFHYLDYQKGVKYLHTALELAESKGIKDLVPVICLNSGAIFSLNQIQFSGKSFSDKSMTFYSKGLKAAYEIKDWKNYLKLLNNILALQTTIPEKPLPNDIKSGFPVSPGGASNDIMYPFTKEHLLAYEALSELDYGKALSHYCRMEGLTSGFQDEIRYQLMAISMKAMVYERMGDVSSALRETLKAIRIAKSNRYDDICVSLYDDARRLYAKNGDVADADRFYISYLKQKDSIFNACQMKMVNEFQFHQEIDKMETTVRDLSYHRKIQNVWLWILGVFSVLAVLFTLYYNYSNRLLRQRNQSLYQKNLLNIETEDRNLLLKKENDELRAELTKVHEKAHDTESAVEKKKYSYSLLDEERKEAIRQKLEFIIEEDPDVFSPDFSLGALAEKAGCPQTYISQVISEKTGKSFYAILSERRIKEACRIMSSPANDRLTIEGVALEVGIRSRSNFTSLFKKFTGLTPGEFIRQTRNHNKSLKENV